MPQLASSFLGTKVLQSSWCRDLGNILDSHLLFNGLLIINHINSLYLIYPTYIKDTNHALNILKQFSFPGNNKFLFTMDITSLYTVIPNNEGLLALKYFFDQRTVKEPSTDTLLHLAELVLTLNCFTFSGEIFKQINGIAMGTKMGPNYANLFVGYVEEQIFNQFDGPKP